MADDDGISIRFRRDGPLEGERYDVRGPYVLPARCIACGVPLMGGATKHLPECTILAIIREHFGDAAADAVTR